MTNPTRRTEIREYILDAVLDHPKTLIPETASRFEITRQAASKHVRMLVAEGLLQATGPSRARVFAPPESAQFSFRLEREGLEEHSVWEDLVRDKVRPFSMATQNIIAYALGEMVNNAIDHSGGTYVSVRLEVSPSRIYVSIHDDGVGIFRKIRDAKNLPDERQAILELSKGKLTTDAARHSGEGIFFTSRAVDTFRIFSHELSFSVERGESWLFGDPSDGDMDGTTVTFTVRRGTTRTLQQVMDLFAAPEAFDFSRTHVPVRLASYEGATLVSRSQAKRVLNRITDFREVILDFDGVSEIGQGFADEIFRIFRNAHPEVELHVEWATAAVAAMIRHAAPTFSPSRLHEGQREKRD